MTQKWNKPLGILVGRRPDVRTFQEDPSLPMSNKYIGIEIEAENIQFEMSDINKNLFYWDIVPDGSLRNFGAEFISKKLRGKDIFLALHELTACLAISGLTPEYSDRTSVHIHADARFMTLDQLRSFIIYYLIHEPLLFAYVGHNREENNYCVPYYLNNRGISNISTIFKNIEHAHQILDTINRAKKYEAMNIHSIQEKGSIEFRAHYGTHDPELILKWVRLILSMFKETKTSLYEQHLEHFLSVPYYFIANAFIEKHGLSPATNLKECEEKARESVGNLLIHKENVYSLEKEMSLHWPKTKPEPKASPVSEYVPAIPATMAFDGLNDNPIDEALDEEYP